MLIKRALLMPSFFVCLCMLLPGCSWVPFWGEEKEPEHFGVLAVRLNKLPPKGKLITYAMAARHTGHKTKNAGFQTLAKDGTAAFVLPMNGIYDVRIFCDLNRNQVLDANEPNAFAQGLSPVPSTAADVATVTLAFGVEGPVSSNAPWPAAQPTPEVKKRPDIPSEAAPYMKYVPQWLQDKLLQ